MRVISGKFKGKKLLSPEDFRVRPTTDRIKETMFNILYSMDAVEGEDVLDLFGGSGALGIEALSRGAASVTFADSDAASVRLIRENLKRVGAEASVFTADYQLALKKLAGREFGLIIADPPYAAGYEADIVSRVDRYGVLKPGGVIMLEHSSQNDLINLPNRFIIDTRSCGHTAVTFLTYSGKEDSPC